MEQSERQETRQLKGKITKEEFDERALALATIEEQLDKLDQQKKEANDEFKRQKGTIVSRKVALVNAIKEGVEDRDVHCEWQENFKQKCWNLVRLDSGKTVDNMAMTAADLQGDLPGTEGGKKGKGKKDKDDKAKEGKKDGKSEDHKDGKAKDGKGEKKPRSRKSGKKE